MAVIRLADLRDKVYTRVEANARFYPSSDVDGRINEAMRITNLFAGWSQGRVSIGLTVVDRSIYRLPSPILFPLRIYLGGKELMKDTYGTIGGTQPAWLRGQGNTPRSWIPLGISLAAIFPTDKRGGQLLEAWGVTEPALLVNDADVIGLSDDMIELITDYAFMNLVLKEGGKIFTDAAKLYKGWLKKMGQMQRWQAEINPNFVIERKKEVAA